MDKLVVNPGTEFSWEVALKEGVSSVGRGVQCDVRLDHESVLDRHAEIHLAAGRAVIVNTGEGSAAQAIELTPASRFRIGAVEMEFAHCEKTLPRRSPASDADAVSYSFFVRQLAEAFCYPFRKSAGYVVVGGAVFFAVCDYLGVFLSFAAVFVQIALAGYLAAYAKDIASGTAVGVNDPPSWPDFSDWIEDILQPAIQLLCVSTPSFGPIVLLQFIPQFQGAGQWTSLVATIWACLTFPILYLALAMTDSIVAVFNPIPLVRAVVRALPGYLTVSLLVLVFVVGSVGFGLLLDRIPYLRLFAPLADRLVEIYFITVLMRTIGIFYRIYHHRFGW